MTIENSMDVVVEHDDNVVDSGAIAPSLSASSRVKDDGIAARKKFLWLAGLFEIAMLFLYGFTVEYADQGNQSTDYADGSKNQYPLFMNVHVMIFVGFGFLMTFAYRYAISAVGFNMLISTLAVQWGILVVDFWRMAFHGHFHNIKLELPHLIEGDFTAATVLISFGAVLGRTNMLQMLGVIFFEIIFSSLNLSVALEWLKVSDVGGSMVVHAFGAYFGVALSAALSRTNKDPGDVRSTKSNTLFAMIGTLFLWMYWPSFNGALVSNAQQYRVIINTVLSMGASCISTFLVSSTLRHGHKFETEDILNATLAGGVAVGSSADLVLQPVSAIAVGLAAGALSVFGYVKITPFLARRFKLIDTCGVHNLHGMPALLASIVSAIAAANADPIIFGQPVTEIFPARGGADQRSATVQGGYQFAALLFTLLIAIVSGYCTGLVISTPFFHPVQKPSEDAEDWELEEFLDQEAEGENYASQGEDLPIKRETSITENEPTEVNAEKSFNNDAMITIDRASLQRIIDERVKSALDSTSTN